jgi:hypothetical protein
METARALGSNDFISEAEEKRLALPEGAEHYIYQLRHAFRASASRRVDSVDWHELEYATAAELDRRRNEVLLDAWPQALQRFERTDEELYSAVVDLLRTLAPKTGRSRHYMAAVADVRSSDAAWGGDSDEPAMAYCRHAALVWIALWHISDIPAARAAHISEYFKRSDFPDSENHFFSDAAKAGTSHLLAKTLRAVAGALRKGDVAH